ncbi:aminotransferase class V-fold PLP-dependent enzyme [Peribacillus sp. SCS-155]|uniref:aminotransferase class V-fold PLP-dependent enzyme n=1 Tax=Peribacillus sedimenti TaxID=3115297 RepID=UPI003905EECB
MVSQSLVYKIADQNDEMEQIYSLNYRTFVEEIPQHPRNGTSTLVDRFDSENTYIIAKKADEVVGMIAVRGTRPFSLDQKIPNLDDYLAADSNPCEIRLLSVKEKFRKSYVFYKLVGVLVSYCLKQGYNMALISGVEQQLSLYRKIGFIEFGTMLSNGNARFQPMYLSREQFARYSMAFSRLMENSAAISEPLNFLPGPVAISETVKKAFQNRPISHRDKAFLAEILELREKLCQMVNANHAEIVAGTGTLGNDIAAGQLNKLPGKGLILVNGEFGNRLIDHANRFQLDFLVLSKEWNAPVSVEEIDVFLTNHPEVSWVWTVHCETSTGYLYDIDGIHQVCKKHNAELCVDACSAIGVIPADYRGLFMAVTVSGKGLGSFPGLAIIYHRDAVRPDTTLPRYLDLGTYASHGSVPFTHSSNLVQALHQAVKMAADEARWKKSTAIRKKFAAAGIHILGDDAYSPGIVTIVAPEGISSRVLGDSLKKSGYLLNYETEYLLKRNWLQAAFMGSQTEENVDRLIKKLKLELEKLMPLGAGSL